RAGDETEEPQVPYHAAAGTRAAPTVLPRRQCGDVAGRGRALRPVFRGRAVAPGEEGFGRILEVVVPDVRQGGALCAPTRLVVAPHSRSPLPSPPVQTMVRPPSSIPGLRLRRLNKPKTRWTAPSSGSRQAGSRAR